jgi:hypothetical protein
MSDAGLFSSYRQFHNPTVEFPSIGSLIHMHLFTNVIVWRSRYRVPAIFISLGKHPSIDLRVGDRDGALMAIGGNGSGYS